MTEKIKIRVFPDYCSSGVWMPDGCNADPEELGISLGLRLALKYWHEIWEFEMTDSHEFDDDGNEVENILHGVSNEYYKRWKEDGKKLAELMSAENDKYYFVA